MEIERELIRGRVVEGLWVSERVSEIGKRARRGRATKVVKEERVWRNQMVWTERALY